MRQLVPVLALIISCGCKPPAKPAEPSPPTAEVAAPADAAASALACASTTEALARLPAPAFVQAEGSEWPPAADGDPCRFTSAEDLDGDGRREIEVACQVGSRDRLFALYRSLPDGCLQPIGELSGMTWEIAQGPRVNGFPPLVSRSGASHDDEGAEVLETHYVFDTASQRYVAIPGDGV